MLCVCVEMRVCCVNLLYGFVLMQPGGLRFAHRAVLKPINKPNAAEREKIWNVAMCLPGAKEKVIVSATEC